MGAAKAMNYRQVSPASWFKAIGSGFPATGMVGRSLVASI